MEAYTGRCRWKLIQVGVDGSLYKYVLIGVCVDRSLYRYV